MKCDYCNKEILGAYSIDSWGQKYHSEHINEGKRCGSCSNLVMRNLMPKPKTLIDGRVICSHCVPESILEERQMKLCVDAIYKFYKMGQFLLPENRITFKLLYSFNLPNNVLGQVEQSANKYKIRMLKGLEKILFCGVLAHELMHVVLSEYNINMQNYEEEGLCELSKFFALKMFNNKHANSWIEAMEKNDNLIYGEGFRIMKDRVKHFGSIQKYLVTLKK